MNKSDPITALAQKVGITHKEASSITNIIFDSMTEVLIVLMIVSGAGCASVPHNVRPEELYAITEQESIVFGSVQVLRGNEDLTIIDHDKKATGVCLHNNEFKGAAVMVDATGLFFIKLTKEKTYIAFSWTGFSGYLMSIDVPGEKSAIYIGDIKIYLQGGETKTEFTRRGNTNVTTTSIGARETIIDNYDNAVLGFKRRYPDFNGKFMKSLGSLK